MDKDTVHTHTHSSVHTMEYYSAIKKNEILPFAATQMDLKGIMLGGISETEKDKYCMISHIWNLNSTYNREYIEHICIYITYTYTYNREYNKETDSQMLRTNQWLPVDRGKVEGQNRGWGFRGTNLQL